MKAYEILTLAKPMLETLVLAGISPKDIQHLELHADYLRLKDEGHKSTYVEAYLCELYGLKKTRFYEIIRKFDKEL